MNNLCVYTNTLACTYLLLTYNGEPPRVYTADSDSVCVGECHGSAVSFMYLVSLFLCCAYPEWVRHMINQSMLWVDRVGVARETTVLQFDICVSYNENYGS